MKAKLRWTSWNVFWVLSASRNWCTVMPLTSGSNFPAVVGRPADGRRRPGGARVLVFLGAAVCGSWPGTVCRSRTVPGVYDSARYGSPSPARQAVITAAVWAGMSMVDVLARVSDGRWRGLASFY